MHSTSATSHVGSAFYTLLPNGSGQTWAQMPKYPTSLAQANVPESASLAMGVACAIAGWWVLDRFSAKEARTKQALPLKSKRN